MQNHTNILIALAVVLIAAIAGFFIMRDVPVQVQDQAKTVQPKR
jgi:hypothetical protein